MAKKKATGDEKNLMIVESPAKAKTLEKFLDNNFIVKSSYGHIRDLPKSDKAIDIANRYEPTYEVSAEKKDVVKELKRLVKDASEVWLATDEDREGEAISWHLCHALGLDVGKTKRIVFHEITKPAILDAVKNPRSINLNMVNAQQARRILDRLVGFELSPILWRKISNSKSLSAGRVQSVAVRLIVEREREITGFSPESSYKIIALFKAKDKFGNNVSFRAELPKNKSNEKTAEEFLKACLGSIYTVKDVQVKPGKKSPSAPFTTSTLQQEASRKLGYSVARTMVIAQKLYEAGKITYMRTDSTNLSDTALSSIKDEIIKSYGKQYSHHRKYATKTANAQEAHEAIRPTYIENKDTDGDDGEQRLYNLIWKRTIASQMSDALLERTSAKISISKVKNEELVASGEVLMFDGFLKVYMESTDDDGEQKEAQPSEDIVESATLPPLTAGQVLEFLEMNATERFTRPSARYTEASLVKKLEELGIGRPSTYAPTISTIQKRGYVEKKDKEGVKRDFILIKLKNSKIEKITESETFGTEKSKMFPTDIGMMVNDFLMQHFQTVMDYGFTAEIEREFDDISNGMKKWDEMIDDFYKPFHKNVENTLENADRVTGERELGVDPKSGRKVIARMGRYGPMVQIGGPDEEEKPRFAKLRSGMNLETITFDEAMALFQLPRVAGTHEGLDVTISEGRFGPYVLYDKKFYSLKKDQDPMTIPLEEAIELINAKQSSVIKEFKGNGISILEGKWGPYVKSGKLNAKIPAGKDPKALSLDDCMELLEKAKEAPKKSFGKFKRKGR
ncbi:MAG: type I DNA topoisomerase [Chitinophagales bacterium]|nr:type I DNA topoisomerase [Chitinophagales bacterium]